MGRRLVQLAGLVLAGAVVVAADFWEEKPFMSWSDKEVQKMLNDSPWSHVVSIVVPRPPVAEGDAGRGRRGGDNGFPRPAPQLKLTVSFRSALPMKQALVRGQFGADGAISDDGQAFLTRGEPYYVVAVLGLPARLGRQTEGLGDATVLRRAEGQPIAPDEVTVQPTGNSVALVFQFPKSDPITLEDREVEFVTKVGELEIKRKFRLRDMVYHGELEL